MRARLYIMSKLLRSQPWTAALCAAVISVIAQAQTPTDHIITRVTAEVAARPADAGAQAKLQAAERVVPGDVLVYTGEVRNAGQYAAESAVVVQPVPNHMMYLADSAVGPGVDVDFSVDGGRSFHKPENLGAAHAEAANAGATHAAARATAAEYTHIRWRLRNRLKPNSIAYVRFRAQVK
jgi:uncharacterized repeat protein (TIGR01451 family)